MLLSIVYGTSSLHFANLNHTKFIGYLCYLTRNPQEFLIILIITYKSSS